MTGPAASRCAAGIGTATTIAIAIIGSVVANTPPIATRNHVRHLRHVVLLIVSLALLTALALALRPLVREVLPLPPPEEENLLVALVLPGPILYFPGSDGAPIGFDADLLRLYAATRNLPLHFVTVDSPAELLETIGRAQAHVGAGGLFRPSPAAAASTGSESAEPRRNSRTSMEWTAGYLTVEPVLIYNRDGFRPSGWGDLEGQTVAFVDGAGLDAEVDAVRRAHPDVKWAPLALPSPAGLIAQVSDGSVDYAIVGSMAAAIAHSIYLDFEIAFTAGGNRDIAWVVPARFAALRADIDAFLARAARDGTIARLRERYAPTAPRFQRVDATGMKERMETVLPELRSLFHEAQEKTGVEWRLVAALAYQESKWDPAAISETGVRGMMQITTDTARQLGISDIADPRQNVVGAARYLRDLKAKLPPGIREPDRTWFALAAYNIGLGHLEDARTLAQRQKLNPHLWSEVRKTLPLLALPEYYAGAKSGYARGGMPVAFVDRVRGYYDLLLAHEAPHQPRLRMFSDAVDRAIGAEPAPAAR